MLSYCWKCKKNTESKNPKLKKKKKQEKTVLSSNSVVSGSKKMRLIKEQETSKTLDSMLGTKILVLGDIPIANIML